VTDPGGRKGRATLLRLLGWSLADATAFAVGTVAAIAVLMNALFIQPTWHRPPVPSDGPAPAQTSVAPHARQVDPTPNPTMAVRAAPSAAKSAAAGPLPLRPSQSTSMASERPPSSKRVIAVQRTLAEYGYGQIKPSGIIDAETQAAIQKFERERKLPITGQASERVVRELAAVTGRALE